MVLWKQNPTAHPGIKKLALRDQRTTASAPTSATVTGSRDRSKQLMVLQGGMA